MVRLQSFQDLASAADVLFTPRQVVAAFAPFARLCGAMPWQRLLEDLPSSADASVTGRRVIAALVLFALHELAPRWRLLEEASGAAQRGLALPGLDPKDLDVGDAERGLLGGLHEGAAHLDHVFANRFEGYHYWHLDLVETRSTVPAYLGPCCRIQLGAIVNLSVDCDRALLPLPVINLHKVVHNLGVYEAWGHPVGPGQLMAPASYPEAAHKFAPNAAGGPPARPAIIPREEELPVRILGLLLG
mmetsp:Transcript_3814/g.10596  ORF Transcript_3814/g.10596 Transcript_3814/m.10596 type:complete len:245 (-) Transcript_3814:313-1047(-)